MTYKSIIDILLSSKVYDLIKENEQDIFNLIKELKICKGFNQNNEWHIYDVYEHILHVVSFVDNNKCLRLSALFHDIGKPIVYTKDNNGIGHFYNHWNESIKIFKKYITKFNLNNEEVKLIINLIFYHDINIEKMTDKEIDEMIDKFGNENIKYLFCLKKADLLSQSNKYHYLLENINMQEKKILTRIKSIENNI